MARLVVVAVIVPAEMMVGVLDGDSTGGCGGFSDSSS